MIPVFTVGKNGYILRYRFELFSTRGGKDADDAIDPKEGGRRRKGNGDI
jgi:hypothetical protein